MASRGDLVAPGQYYLQAQYGVLYLYQKIGDDTVTVSFEEFTLQQLEDTDYEISINDNHKVELVFPREKLQTLLVSEDGNTMGSKLNPRTRMFVARVSPYGSSTTKRTLSYYNIIEGTLSVKSDFFVSGKIAYEVPYLDGLTEFLGLTETREYTNSIQAGPSGLIQFQLSAQQRWYHSFDVQFSNSTIFNTKVVTPTSVGEYSINNSGFVTVYIGAFQTLPSGIEMYYKYKDPLYNPEDKYSVDYTNGYIYTYAEQNMNSLIDYQTATYKIEYDMCTSVKFEQTDKNVVVKDNLISLSDEYVVIEETAPQGTNLLDYYSPVITLIGFRFS